MFNVNTGKKMLNNKDTRVLFIFISYLRLVMLSLRAGRHGKILIEKGTATQKSLGTSDINYVIKDKNTYT
jgi:hypothetical protein